MYKHIQIELSNYCNLSCVECPHHLMKRGKQYMNDEVFETVLSDYIKDKNLNTIILHKDGEPLLHPNIRHYLCRISDTAPKAKIDLYTNGLLLTSDFIKFLGSLNNRVLILISFHFFNTDGKKNNYDKASSEIKASLEICPSNVEFVFTTHVTKLADINKLKKWREDWLNLRKKYKMLKDVHVNNSINPWTGLIEAENTVTFPTCPYADGAHLFIGNTGKVLACCLDLEEDIVFGNVLKTDRDKILLSRSKFYESLSTGNIGGLCLTCLTSKE